MRPAAADRASGAVGAGARWSGKVWSGFPKRSCSNNNPKRDDDSSQSHRALEAQAHAHPTMILALHAKNTANIARVAAVSTLSKAYFIAGPRFRAPPSKDILIPRESGHRVSMELQIGTSPSAPRPSAAVLAVLPARRSRAARRRPNEQWPTRLPLQQHRGLSILLVRSRQAWPIPRSSKRGSSRR